MKRTSPGSEADTMIASTRSARWGLLLIVAGLAAVACVGIFNIGATAGAAPSSPASPIDWLARLQQDHSGIDVANAMKAVADADGTIWVAPADDGNVCVIEEPINRGSGLSVVHLRFGCRERALVDREGLIAGAPGHWYGIAPRNGARVTAMVDGRATAVEKTGRVFRLPADADAVAFDAGPPTPVASK